VAQSCKFAELSELSCQLSSGSAQVFQKGSQLSSAQLRFSKIGSAQLSELSELTELTLDDSATNDVVFSQIDSYWLKPTYNLEYDWLIFGPVLESCWLFAEMREKLKRDRSGPARSSGLFYCAPARTHSRTPLSTKK
jgi:hypothetical protein